MEKVRFEIEQFYYDNRFKGKPFVVKLLLDLGYGRSTIYRTMARVDKGMTLGRKSREAPNKRKLTPEEKRKLKRLTVGQVSKSYRKLGRILHMDGKTIKSKMEEMNLTRERRKWVPRVNEATLKKQTDSENWMSGFFPITETA